MQDTIETWREQFPTHTNISSGPKYVHPASEIVTIEGLVKMARTSNSQIAAILAITTSVSQGPLIWNDSQKRLSQIETQFFLKPAFKIIENIMILGYVVWRIHGGELEVAEPNDFQLKRKTNRWVPVHTKRTILQKGSKEWHVTIFDQPAIFQGAFGGFSSKTLTEKVVTAAEIRSACSRSYLEAVRQQTLERNYLARDRFNSAPSVFTSVSENLGNTSGSLRTWYKDVNMNAAGRLSHATSSGIATQRGTDFNKLIANRADTLQRLSANTAEERRKAEQTHAPMIEDGLDIETHHQEFVLTDGKTMNDSKSLLSCGDATFQYNRVRQSVLLLMGVPAQALGESVNTERNAANNRQYETAMLLYAGTIQRVRTLLNSIFEHYGKSGGKYPLSVAHITPHAVETLAPILKTEALASAFADVYSISIDSIDLTRLKTYQDALISTKSGNSSLTELQVTGDDNAKRARLERKSANREKKTADAESR